MTDLIVTALVGLASGVLGAGVVVLGLRQGWFEGSSSRSVDLSVVSPPTVTDKEVLEAVETILQRPLRPMLRDLTAVVVPLPSEDVKGRLIGREGRNIRTFEELTGVDLIIDETPEAVTLSSFDPVRRTIALITLENLILDGRIHPGRIEEIYREAEEALPLYLAQEAQRALEGLELELGEGEVREFGELLLKQADGVNLFDRTVQVAGLAGELAGELGTDVLKVRRRGVEWGLGQKGELGSAEVALVELAVRICDERPGGKHPGLGQVIDRMAEVEAFLLAQPEVERAVAVKAGKEIRVTVSAGVSEDRVSKLADDLAKRVRSAMDLGGPVKLTVVRRAESSAKIS